MTLSNFDRGVDYLLGGVSRAPSLYNLINTLKESNGRMIEYLYIKREDLAQEAKTIRKYENHAKFAAQNGYEVERSRKLNAGLHQHRIFDVRKEQRSTLIAIGFLKGKKYRQIERLAYDQPDWDRIERLIMKYSEEDSRKTAQKFAEWKAEALQGEKPIDTRTWQPGAHRGRLTRWMYLGRHGLQALEPAE